MNEQKNLVLAIVLSAIVFFGWQILVVNPQRQAIEQSQQVTQQATQPTGTPAGEAPRTDSMDPVASTGMELDPAEGVAGTQSRADALAKSGRVTINSPRLGGSIALTGAIVDDILLKDYREEVELDSPNITVLNPTGSNNAYIAKFGWSRQKGVTVPQVDTVWTADRDVLTVDAPVTLSWANGEGLIFEQEFSIDRNFMISVTQRVRNRAQESVSLQTYGVIRRFGKPNILGFYLLHEGLLGIFDNSLTEVDYDELEEDGPVHKNAQGGWLGITDKYWLAAIIPAQEHTVDANFTMGENGGVKTYQADYVGPAIEARPGGVAETSGRLFVGAKELSLLDRYAEETNVPNFDLAVDFGWFYFLTKPMFITLDVLFGWWGNFGLAILSLTLIIKALLFPIANKSYKSMSKMKLLAPKMAELKERYGDDRMRLNQEVMELYKREKVNPAAGCLPIIPQMFIFFALYKVLFVSIEMRHAPFFGWIVDLSAPDPLGALTLFGLISWQVPAFLAMFNIGIWPILMGLSMYAMQKLNPPPPDPMQAKIMNMLPIVFTFFLATFPAGLVLYWTWNNLLSIAQQWTIMKRMEKQLQQQKIP
ncbi:MAG: membrane protein insertase YidC [Alphaproteobacteria bacterium]|nr:membrane protein insertase YidC [Alphaproteobacteria bacterium]